MTAVVMTTVGMQRNSPRIWLEGRKLEREGGFRPEVTYRLDDSRPDSLTLVAAADGDRVVSGRKRQAYRAPRLSTLLTRSYIAGSKMVRPSEL